MNRQIEKRAAETLLDKGVSVSFRAPLFVRLFGKKRINTTIHNPTGGTLIKILTYYLSIELSDEEMLNTRFSEILKKQVKHNATVYKMVATAMLPGRVLQYMFTRLLGWWLAGRFPLKSACAIAQLLVLQGGVEDFMNIIELGTRLNMMTPKTSQTTDHMS